MSEGQDRVIPQARADQALQQTSLLCRVPIQEHPFQAQPGDVQAPHGVQLTAFDHEVLHKEKPMRRIGYSST